MSALLAACNPHHGDFPGGSRLTWSPWSEGEGHWAHSASRISRSPSPFQPWSLWHRPVLQASAVAWDGRSRYVRACHAHLFPGTQMTSGASS